jgi:ribonuclease P protein component
LRFFNKADRLLKRSEFLRLAKTGKKIQNSCFIAIYAPGRVKRTRLGVTVTRNVGNATTRNRIKRFAREYFRLNKHNITGCWDINIISKKKTADLTSRKAFLSLQNIFNRMFRSLDI